MVLTVHLSVCHEKRFSAVRVSSPGHRRRWVEPWQGGRRCSLPRCAQRGGANGAMGSRGCRLAIGLALLELLAAGQQHFERVLAAAAPGPYPGPPLPWRVTMCRSMKRTFMRSSTMGILPFVARSASPRRCQGNEVDAGPPRPAPPPRPLCASSLKVIWSSSGLGSAWQRRQRAPGPASEVHDQDRGSWSHSGHTRTQRRPGSARKHA